jgi:hypothetical protein
MRPPEWRVWAVILALVAWLVDNRWPSDTVRVAAWNGAVALGAVYWLNGLGILLCAMEAFRFGRAGGAGSCHGFLLSSSSASAGGAGGHLV